MACLHPGWEPLVGREAVVTSWRRILLGGGAPAQIRCERAQAHVTGDAAWVVCAEVIPRHWHWQCRPRIDHTSVMS